jgi:LAO/AO transport system kinase
VEVAGLADTTVVLLAPDMGDGIQAAKAGVLEVGDIFVVNKADRDGADSAVRELRYMVSLEQQRQPHAWRAPIIKTVAVRGEGLDEVVDALDKHRSWLEETGQRAERRRRRAIDEVATLALSVLRDRMRDDRSEAGLDDLGERVARGELDPYAAADLLIASLNTPPS